MKTAWILCLRAWLPTVLATVLIKLLIQNSKSRTARQLYIGFPFGRRTLFLNRSEARIIQTKKRKKFFSFFTLTPSQMWLKRPVYRGFKCEGKCFYPHTYPHTCFHTLTPSLFRQKASCLSGIQWVGVNSGFIGRIAMLCDEYRYVMR